MRGNEGYESITEGKQIEEDGKIKKLLMHHLILSVSPASVDHLQTSLLLPPPARPRGPVRHRLPLQGRAAGADGQQPAAEGLESL